MFTVFLAEWSSDSAPPTFSELLRMRYGRHRRPLVKGGRRGLFGVATFKIDGRILLCLRLRLPRSLKAVIEALRAFVPLGSALTLTGLMLRPVDDDSLFRRGLRPFLQTQTQHRLFLMLEAGFLSGRAFTYAPSGGNRSLFGREAPLNAE